MVRAILSAALLALATGHGHEGKQGQGHGGQATAATAAPSEPGNFGMYMSKYLPRGDDAYTSNTVGGNAGWRSYMDSSSSYMGGLANYTNWMSEYGGKASDYNQYVTLYSSMAGSNPTSGTNYQGKQTDQVGAWNNSMSQTFDKYMPGSYKHLAQGATSSRANSGGNGAAKPGQKSPSPASTSLSASPAAQGDAGGGSDASEGGGGYQKYMSQYASKYMGGGAGGGYSSYMNQYASNHADSMSGSKAEKPHHEERHHARSSLRVAATTMAPAATSRVSIDRVGTEAPLRTAARQGGAPHAEPAHSSLAAEADSSGVHASSLCLLAVAAMGLPVLMSFAHSMLQRQRQQARDLSFYLLA